MAKRNGTPAKRKRRTFARDFKMEAVQMMVDGYSARSVSENLGIGNTNLLYRWKADLVAESGEIAETLDHEVRDLRDQLRRVERERDILKKPWPVFYSVDL